MKNDILLLAQLVANEKNIEQDDVFVALELALAGIARKTFPHDEEVNIQANIDRQTGDYTVTHFIYNENGEILKEDPLEVSFGRIAAKSAKQIIVQHLREAESKALANTFNDRMGNVFYGSIKRTVRDGYLVNIDEKVDALLPHENILPQEHFRIGDRVKAILCAVKPHRSGPQLILSRIANSMLEQLFNMEVPEIEEQVIEIKAIAREPGLRAKVLVKTNDRRIDPIGACIGMRGKRVQIISEEMGGERIDIILWDANIGQLVINALSPAQVEEVLVDENKKSIDVGIAEDNLAKAIGRNGQNVRLVSELIGWSVNIISTQDLIHNKKKELDYLVNMLSESLEIDRELSQYLCDSGLNTPDNIVHATADQLSKLDLDSDTIDEIQERSRNLLLSNILSDSKATQMPHKDLLCIDGMNTEIANLLANKDILTKEHLADLSVDELTQISKISETEAAKLIMQARESWFTK
jgi:transcription termination/antitermination protein NusA